MSLSPTILVIDDEPDVAQFMADVAELCGFKPTISTTKTKTVSVIGGGANFDCVILDIIMPELDGVEVVRILSESKYSGILIIVSGRGVHQMETVSRLAELYGLNLGASVSKPVRLEELESVLRASLLKLKPVLKGN